MKAAPKIHDLYKSVTDDIIRELESGSVPPWLKPWKTDRKNVGGIMPHNAISGRCYSGINVPILWHQADVCEYERHSWLTFKQALEKDAAVRKGEKGTHVVFTKKLIVKDENDEETKRNMLRTFVVFNVAQIDGLPEQTEPPPSSDLNRDEAVEAFIAATKADIRHGGDKACFVPSKDFINMPPPSSFKEIESYFATSLHELGHWSGHKSRLDRDLSGRFGTQAYAAEELVAELNSAFLCAHLNIKGEIRHAGYIEHWITLLRSDDRAIFTVASKASQAANYLRGFSETIEENLT